jgi:hypothetical protein
MIPERAPAWLKALWIQEVNEHGAPWTAAQIRLRYDVVEGGSLK